MRSILNTLKDGKTYYKIGDKPVKVLNQFVLQFLKGRIFDKKELKNGIFKIKDNISYIHFDKAFYNNTDYAQVIEASPETEVNITVDKNQSYCFIIRSKNVTINEEENSNSIFNIEIKDALSIFYDKKSFAVHEASKTYIQGNVDFSCIDIESATLEINNSSLNSQNFCYGGNELKLTNVSGKINKVEIDTKNIELSESKIISTEGIFSSCLRTAFVNSTWKVSTPLRYVDGTLGNSETGITITDKTFGKESIELARAYATYGLREFLNNVAANNELEISPKLEAIAERKRALKEEYEKALASLESREEDIIFGHKHRKVKNLVKKKEN